MIETNIQIIEDLKNFVKEALEDRDLRRKIIKNENDFTRDRKLTFENIVYFLLNISRKTLTVELKEFFEILGKPESKCTKSAFTQQRKKLKSLFFKAWNSYLANCFYTYHTSHLWNGFRLYAIDGSTLYLPQTKELLKYFGSQKNQYGGKAMARTLFIYDVLNNIIVHSEIQPIKMSESAILNNLISHLPDDSIAIYDRGFPSYKNMYLHMSQETEKKFVMRCSLNENNMIANFVKSGKRNMIVNFVPPKSEAIKQLYELGYKIAKDTIIRVRLIRVELDNGEIEVLATNLYDSIKYPTSQFKALYFMRWGVETSINYLKNIYQVELFSGYSIEAIKQDFYATMFTFNLHSILIKQCESNLKQTNLNKKYEYKINRTTTLGFIKGELILLFINENPEEILLKMRKEFLKELIPIRDGRKYIRSPKIQKRGKYQTLTNYKHAV